LVLNFDHPLNSQNRSSVVNLFRKFAILEKKKDQTVFRKAKMLTEATLHKTWPKKKPFTYFWAIFIIFSGKNDSEKSRQPTDQMTRPDPTDQVEVFGKSDPTRHPI